MKVRLSDKAKDVIKVVAPTLGAALGGPLGGLAGQILGSLVGGDSANLEKALLEQSPEAMLNLRKAEQEFVLKLEELGVERDRIEMADRVSARDMAKVNMKPQMVLSSVFMGGYFLLLLSMIFGGLEVSDFAENQFPTLMGVLTTGVPIILAFWFGSSAGSATKSALLQQSKPVNVD